MSWNLPPGVTTADIDRAASCCECACSGEDCNCPEVGAGLILCEDCPCKAQGDDDREYDRQRDAALEA